MVDTISDATSLLRAGVQAVSDLDVSALDGARVAALIDELEARRRRLDALDTRLLAAAEDCRAAGGG
jgi:hypothetical protein